MSYNNLNCEEIKLNLDAFHDGELTEVERLDVEHHLSVCDACRQQLSAIGSLAASLQALPQLASKTDLATVLAQRLGAASTAPQLVTGSGACDEFKPMLDSYHDGELSFQERSDLESHLHGCAPCRAELSEIRIVAASLKALPLLSPKLDVASNIESLLAKRTRKVTVLRSRAIWSSAGVAAAAVACIFLFKSNSALQPNNLAANHTDSNHQVQVAENPTVSKPFVVSAPVHVATPKTQSTNIESSPKQIIASRPEDRNKKLDLTQSAKVAAPGFAKTDRDRSKSAAVEIASVPPPIDSSRSVAGPTVDLKAQSPDGGALDNGKVSKGIVALYDGEQQNNITEELGITTDEDGLYAIKL